MSKILVIIIEEAIIFVNRRIFLNRVKKYIEDYLWIAVGSFILAFAVSVFLVPCKISTGGVSGVATVLYYVFEIPMPVTTLVINLLLFVFGFKFLARSSILKTLAGIIFFSSSLYFTDRIAIFMASFVASITKDVWIAAVFGGVLVGVGVGIVVKRNASTGGSDFAALTLNRLIPHVSVGIFIMIIDSAIIVLSGVAFLDLSVMFYSVASLYISTKVTDFILTSGDNARCVYVISGKSSDIAKRFMIELERGVTALRGRGCYENVEREMLMCIVSVKEVPRVVGIVREVDRYAFTVISEVKEVRGLGFKEETNIDYERKETEK